MLTVARTVVRKVASGSLVDLRAFSRPRKLLNVVSKF